MENIIEFTPIERVFIYSNIPFKGGLETMIIKKSLFDKIQFTLEELKEYKIETKFDIDTNIGSTIIGNPKGSVDIKKFYLHELEIYTIMDVLKQLNKNEQLDNISFSLYMKLRDYDNRE